MSARLQHYLNPVHIYCRLRDLGMGKSSAVFLCRVYERAIFKCVMLNGGATKRDYIRIPGIRR